MKKPRGPKIPLTYYFGATAVALILAFGAIIFTTPTAAFYIGGLAILFIGILIILQLLDLFD